MMVGSLLPQEGQADETSETLSFEKAVGLSCKFPASSVQHPFAEISAVGMLVRVLVLGCHSWCHRCIQLQQQVLAMTETLSDATEPMSRVRVTLIFESEVLII